ncbi:cysteine desulfurase CsdA [Ignatzschineria ureiclastica]|uniref:Probable cysteine desulfurase n=1 Tax=Ignatzschineria ureiclastica TaxID=472582 RepID=A0A2U2ACZ7_9GAMM|nr:cysteine desulfurase [Ignatzschineria ureiclastica]PWD80535.1 cysteine desulfurase CsdA [Ignatzschineria ureiclastica]GGZ98724.1 cysteine desulfurase [Ignatzschineria ureiclastica]
MIALPEIRAQFPILQQAVKGQTVAFLDTGASAQKPQQVIDAERAVYEHYYANIHRGVYYFSEKSTQEYEAVRELVRAFIKAEDPREIIFTKGTTESINLVAQSYGRKVLQAGDIVIISEMEHHANIVPWQMICEEKGAILKVIPINDAGELEMDQYRAMLNDRVKIVSVTQVSNVLGTINDVATIVNEAHKVGAKVLIDGAQGVVHQPLDVMALDADFYVFSAHKLYGPSGVGVLYGKRTLLEAMPPYQTGGDMIDVVTFEKTTFAPLPNKFEAGTPNIAGVIAFGEAIKWVTSVGFELIESHEKALLEYATSALSQIPELRIIGTAENKAGVISFVIKGIHPHDIGTLLDHEGVAVRVGHHCAQPLMKRMKVPATARMSLGVYNTSEEIDRLVAGLKKIIALFG